MIPPGTFPPAAQEVSVTVAEKASSENRAEGGRCFASNITAKEFSPVVPLPATITEAEAQPARDLASYTVQPLDSVLTASEREQLAWVNDNPLATPEVTSSQLGVHVEIFRALNRIDCLNLLISGSEDDYQAFIAQQLHKEIPDVLERASFNELSTLFQSLDECQREVLRVATILSSVTRSPTAIARAKSCMVSVPEDSVKFLSATAHRSEIYPLTKALFEKYPRAQALLQVVFMPDSHLRHMMNNEGALAMYQNLAQRLSNNQLSSAELDLWVMYWVINITGFRARDLSKGSEYLSENIFRCIQTLLPILRGLGSSSENPVKLYLTERAQWLDLPALTPDLQLAFGSLAALFYVYGGKGGKVLEEAFSRLRKNDQQRWQTYVRDQMTNTTTPSPTYAPAFFNKLAGKLSGVANAVAIGLPIFLDAIDKERALRQAGTLSIDTPLSFLRLAMSEENIDKIVDCHNVLAFDINPGDGCIEIQNAARHSEPRQE